MTSIATNDAQQTENVDSHHTSAKEKNMCAHVLCEDSSDLDDIGFANCDHFEHEFNQLVLVDQTTLSNLFVQLQRNCWKCN